MDWPIREGKRLMVIISIGPVPVFHGHFIPRCSSTRTKDLGNLRDMGDRSRVCIYRFSYFPIYVEGCISQMHMRRTGILPKSIMPDAALGFANDGHT